jgi:O-antigen/teichoic acid export membrane protein
VPDRSTTWRRLWDSALLWSWAFTGLRIGSALILLPVLLRHLSENDLGMHYIFVGLNTILPMVDAVFAFNIGRFIGYATGLAGQERDPADSRPGVVADLDLTLGELVAATRRLHVGLALLVGLGLATFGSAMVAPGVAATTSTDRTWLAWSILVAGSMLEAYGGWFHVVLRGRDAVTVSARVRTVIYLGRIAVAVALLQAGAGLLAMPTAWLVAAVGQILLSRLPTRRCLAGVPEPPGPAPLLRLLRLVYPSSWRVGLQMLTGYLCLNAIRYFVLRKLGLGANATFGLSVQVADLIHTVAATCVTVKWPAINQWLARGDWPPVRTVLRQRVTLASALFLLAAVAAVTVGQPLLDRAGVGKTLLPPLALSLLLVQAFGEMQVSTWTMFLASCNRFPFTRSMVLTHALAAGTAGTALFWFEGDLTAVVLAQLTAWSLFNHWYWPWHGGRLLAAGTAHPEPSPARA